jgi:ribosomal protein S18 acetylase RimI-like enzyme
VVTSGPHRGLAEVDVRRATPEDHPWITALSELVFRDLGAYGDVMPQWLRQPGVIAWVAVDDPARHTADGRCGFAMLGFYVDPAVGGMVADLLGIAVAPTFQGRGIGSRLLHQVLAVAAAVAPAHGCAELRLTVAHSNPRAQAWYRREGFAPVPGDHGAYASGQRAIRMARSLAR